MTDLFESIECWNEQSAFELRDKWASLKEVYQVLKVSADLVEYHLPFPGNFQTSALETVVRDHQALLSILEGFKIMGVGIGEYDVEALSLASIRDLRNMTHLKKVADDLAEDHGIGIVLLNDFAYYATEARCILADPGRIPCADEYIQAVEDARARGYSCWTCDVNGNALLGAGVDVVDKMDHIMELLDDEEEIAYLGEE